MLPFFSERNLSQKRKEFFFMNIRYFFVTCTLERSENKSVSVFWGKNDYHLFYFYFYYHDIYTNFHLSSWR